ncbi:MAG: acyltransferase [Desulfuromonas sp.]|uniref:acyltransferase n=1 Tax=Desulfuromonas sp. TaxID=892 RepID=UPI000CBC75F8|nr:acyltransferase [Desulfuromonas sp.]PLX84211.1 MAG: acyltransferase [Desulfuromonas sp.]
MLTFLPPTLRGCISIFLVGLNTALVSLPLFLLALLKFLVPFRPWRRFCGRALNKISEIWIALNSGWMRLTQDLDWKVQSPEGLSRDDWYLVTCNHQSWADIFIAQHLLNRRIPQMKFFLKQELIWVPVLGMCWWALDFPFMKRYTRAYLKKHPEKIGKDLETTRQACEKFRDIPVAIFNFMEGTRFSPAKHKSQRPPFRHLLKPRTAGTGFVLSHMGQNMRTLIDITISYGGPVPTFWDFLCGRTGQIRVTIEKVPIPTELLGRDYTSDAPFRSQLQRWVSGIWTEKDRKLAAMQ